MHWPLVLPTFHHPISGKLQQPNATTGLPLKLLPMGEMLEADSQRACGARFGYQRTESNGGHNAACRRKKKRKPVRSLRSALTHQVVACKGSTMPHGEENSTHPARHEDFMRCIGIIVARTSVEVHFPREKCTRRGVYDRGGAVLFLVKRCDMTPRRLSAILYYTVL